MPISIATERVITLTEAAERLPCSRRGKKIHKSTLVRWAKRGCRGYRLEVVRVGSTLCTSAEALQRFLERISSDLGAAESPQPPLRPRTSVDALLRNRGLLE